MQIFKEIGVLRAFLNDLKRAGKSTGFVPTMGALHDGHTQLIKASKQENDVTICSIFVNPKQFNNPQDLENYPRTFDLDAGILEKVGCDILFAPGVAEMYPSSNSTIGFNLGGLETEMEGKYRPGHFNGVALVVLKLFNIVFPSKAYFGQKDWQQFVIVKTLVSELNLPIQLISVPTVREADGLAMSSRNRRLSPQLRKEATILFRALNFVSNELREGQTFEYAKSKAIHSIFEVSDVKLDYLELADSENLKIIDSVKNSDRPILCVAAFVGDIRLIDNMFLDLHPKQD